MEAILFIISYVWWITPFTFVFSLLVAIKETIHNVNNDITYGLIASVSLLILAIACIFSSY